jgi:hypothetical protein
MIDQASTTERPFHFGKVRLQVDDLHALTVLPEYKRIERRWSVRATQPLERKTVSLQDAHCENE